MAHIRCSVCNRYRKTSQVFNLCEDCYPGFQQAALSRDFSLCDAPARGSSTDRIVRGVRFWYWRGKWRSDGKEQVKKESNEDHA